MKTIYKVDGNKICATWEDFDNLQESPAGFGNTFKEANMDLLETQIQAWGLEALIKMRECEQDGDTECAHVRADQILADFVEQMGFVKLSEVYQSIDKWYA